MTVRTLAAAILVLVSLRGPSFAAEFQPTQRHADLPAEVQKALPKARAIFWQQTTNFRDGEKAAWLLGLNEGAGPYARQVLLIDETGAVLTRAPEVAGGYQTAFVARIGRERWVMVLSEPAGRKLSSKVTILLLDATPTVVFTCESPPLGPLWNSVIYLVDVDGDQTTDLLVDREVFLDGRRTREQLLYRYDERHSQFRETMAPRDWLAKALFGARNNPATPQAVQYTESFGR